MADERDEIRARIDIVDLVGREIQLKKAGKNWKGLCPFHPDKNPSFIVTRETGRYKCWSCGETGDIFNWEMKRRNVEFVEALQTLAREAGVTLKLHKASGEPSQRLVHEGAMTEALTFFREQLPKNASAREYCERRGLAQATLDKWEIGYAPDVGEALAVRLKKAGFSLAECKALFLVDTDSRDGYYDKFRGRLMFPIRDEKGQLVAFGGRVLGDGTPKYINSSDTPLYRKSRVLYGMHVARDTISKLRQAVLVEGYLDVIACHQGGITQALASLGTSLSEDHAKLLKRWCDEVVILYDSDDAGRKAADRAIEVLRAEGVRVRVALMPQGEDPDTLLKNGGPAALKDAVDGALSPMAYKLQALDKRLTVKEDAYWNEVAIILAGAESRAEMDRHLTEIAPKYPWEKSAAKATTLLRHLVNGERARRRQGDGQERASTAREHFAVKGSLSSPEIILLRGFLSEEFRRVAWQFACAIDLYETPTGEQVGQAIKAAFPDEAPEGSPGMWLHSIEPDELRQLLSDLTLDFRADKVSEDVLLYNIKRLQQNQQQRHIDELKRSGVPREEIMALIKQRKPDTKIVQKQSDSLF